jgi:hypothetical protein
MTALEPPPNFTKKGDENRSCKSWKPVSWIPWTAGRIMRTRRSMEVLQICRKRAMVVVVVVVGSKRKNPSHLCKSVPVCLSLFCLLCSSVHRKRRDSPLVSGFIRSSASSLAYSQSDGTHTVHVTIQQLESTHVSPFFVFVLFFSFGVWYNKLNLKLVIKKS